MELAKSKSKNDIDLLICLNFCQLFVTGNVKFGDPGEPVRVEIKSGWVLNGHLKDEDVNDSSSTNFVREVSSHVLFIHSNQSSKFVYIEIER